MLVLESIVNLIGIKLINFKLVFLTILLKAKFVAERNFTENFIIGLF